MKQKKPKEDQKINDLDSASTVIMDAIVTQSLAPGQKVSENILSDNFCISRTISRNLIERLITKQFLTTVSQRVTQVSALTLLDIKQNFILRKILLPEIFSLASTNIDYEHLMTLNSQIKALSPITDDKTALDLLKRNKELNLIICEKSRYPLMLDWAEQLEDMAMRIYWLYIKTTRHFPYSSEQQTTIISIIKSGETAAIRRALHDRLTQTEDRILNAIFSHKQFYTQSLTV
ncbi:MAG: GntR family transcriptional regulator [Pseudomonadales bacterium]